MKSEYYNLQQEFEYFYATLKDKLEDMEIDSDASVEENQHLLIKMQNIIENVINTIDSDIEDIQDYIANQKTEDSLFTDFIEDKDDFLEMEKMLSTINILISDMYDTYSTNLFPDFYKSYSKEQELVLTYEKELEEEKENLERELNNQVEEEELEEHENTINEIEEKIKKLESYKNEADSSCEEYKESYDSEIQNISAKLENIAEKITDIISNLQPFIEQLIEMKNTIYPEKIENDKNYSLINILEAINNQEKNDSKKQIKRKI